MCITEKPKNGIFVIQVIKLLIKAPKNRNFDAGMRSLGYHVTEENELYVTYSGVFGLMFDMRALQLNYREFIKFCKVISVNGGKKIRKGSTLYITPYRNRFLAVKLSEDEYVSLEKCAKIENMSPRNFFREYLLRALAKRKGL